MKKVSIKTVDGSRHECVVEDQDIISDPLKYTVLCLPVRDGIKYFNTKNIVSITVTDIND